MKDLSSKVRHKFNFPSDKDGKPVIELRALTHGLPPKAIGKNLELFQAEWKENGVSAWNELTESADVFLIGDEDDQERAVSVGWWNLPEVIGDRFISKLLNASRGTCIMVPNATQAILSLLSCKELNKEGKRGALCTDAEFPAVLHSLYHHNQQFEGYSENIRSKVAYNIAMVEIGSESFDADKIIAEINEKTALVIFSHIGFVRGERITDDAIRKVADAAHAHGALIAIDGYHAMGSQIIDVQKMDVDIYIGGLLKEGCGSSGSCFLYVKPGTELTPSVSGWLGDKEPFAFNHKPQTHSSVCRRFLTGTTPIAPLYHSVEGLKIMFQLGLEEVANDVIGKVEMMTMEFLNNSIKVMSPEVKDQMSSMIVLEVEEADKLRDYLIRNFGIMTDARRGRFLRLAPHIYNSVEELQFAAKTIIESAHNKDYFTEAIAETNGPVT